MLTPIKLKTSIESLFFSQGEPEPAVQVLLNAINFEMLNQITRHNAEPVYTYRTDTEEDSGCVYRGALLFPQPATLLYSLPFVHAESDTGVVFERRVELWLLWDMSFAVTANARHEHCEGTFVSEYRTLKTKDLDLFLQVIDLDLGLLAVELLTMSKEYLDASTPTYEL